MELIDTSGLRAVLSRGALDDRTYLAAVIVRATYSLGSAAPTATDDAAFLAAGPQGPLGWGTSVTLNGTARPRSPGDTHRRLRVAFGGRLSSAWVFGERRWQRANDDLVPSSPEPLRPTVLSHTIAFGGTFHEPPGEMHGLPHPGFEVAYSVNPEGTGFYGSMREAEGRPLPAIELDEALIRSWTDRPEPALFAPCPKLVAARMPSREEIELDPLRAPSILAHAAPRRHIVERMAPGERILVDGLSERPFEVTVPASPLRVWAWRRRRREEIGSSLRWIHLDVDEERCHVLFSHAFACPVDTLPKHIVSEGAS